MVDIQLGLIYRPPEILFFQSEAKVVQIIAIVTKHWVFLFVFEKLS